MICKKCGHELSGPDDTHLCRPAARDIVHDIIEAAPSPTGILAERVAMEDVCEAAGRLADDRPCMPIEQSLMMPASVDAVIAAKARLDELRGKS